MAKRVIRRRDGEDFHEAVPASQTVYVTDSRSTAANIVYWVAGVVMVLLGLRFIFRLFEANSANAFVAFIYGLTRPLVAPFFGIFNIPIDTTVGAFEIATLLAMAIYALVAYLIIALIRAFTTE